MKTLITVFLILLIPFADSCGDMPDSQAQANQQEDDGMMAGTVIMETTAIINLKNKQP